jgi:hypothetical protein
MLLAGVCSHGCGAWSEIAADARLDLMPGIRAACGEAVVDGAAVARFLTRRLRLLETALLVEEQLLRGLELGLAVPPSQDNLACAYTIAEIQQRVSLLAGGVAQAYAGDSMAGVVVRKGLSLVMCL